MGGREHGINTEGHPGAQGVYARDRALQDFALCLARQMRLSLVLSLLENGAGVPSLVSLALGCPEQGWHVSYGTLEEVAHQLHTLGMSYWAEQRRQYRQRQKGDI
jgi:hypothetical protein